MALASDPSYDGPEAALPSDPAWARPHALLDVVPLPASTRAVARLALHRAAQLLVAVCSAVHGGRRCGHGAPRP